MRQEFCSDSDIKHFMFTSQVMKLVFIVSISLSRIVIHCFIIIIIILLLYDMIGDFTILVQHWRNNK